MTLRIAELTTLSEFHQVERLEAEIWGPVDLVPLPILAVTVKRGAVLIGAFDGDRLAGFVYSFPALRPEGPSHWSHMLGVHPDYRGAGLGRDLKLAQRERVMALGLDLIEWTYDPLQAPNAQLNIVALGAIVEEYEQNVYGESASPLHGGLPTDRFVCQWWIRRPHVARRIQQRAAAVGRADRIESITLVAREVAEAPVVSETSEEGAWLECGAADLTRTEPRLAVDIPIDYTGMLSADLARAHRWRLHTREIFTHYFRAGYRVVDFTLHRQHHRGRYLLTSIPPIG